MKKLLLLLLLTFLFRSKLYAYDLNNFNSISKLSDIEKSGYEIKTKHTIKAYFGIDTIKDNCNVVTAINNQYGIVAIFVVNQKNDILYKTKDLACNSFLENSIIQPNVSIKAVSSRDLDKNGYDDIIIISKCLYDGKEFKIADIIFQKNDMLYRDLRITDKLNRFNINKDVATISRFVSDGESPEFLYNASDYKQVVSKGFTPIKDQMFDANFEKFGSVTVVPGTYKMGNHNVFIVYLVDKNNKIVWNFQCMRDYDNFSHIKSISFKDIDGDGWKDFLILAQYNTLDDNDKTITVTDFAIFYQRTGYFFEDKDFHDEFFKKLSNKEVMNDIVVAARKYWGW